MAGFFYLSKRRRNDRRIRTSDDLLYKHKVIFGTKIFDDLSTPFRRVEKSTHCIIYSTVLLLPIALQDIFEFSLENAKRYCTVEM